MRRAALRVLTALRRLAMVALLVAILLGLGDRDAPRAERLPELDVVVVVDRTTSMSALDDPAGARLLAAGRDLATFSDHLESARFTVIALGRTPQLALPPTSDRIALRDVVRQLRTEPADVGTGSSSGRAVAPVEDWLGQDRGDRIPVLVYVGDGEDDPSDRSRSFTELRGRLAASLVLGYGTEAGGVMPLVLARSTQTQRAVAYVPDPRTGQDAVSHADPARLAEIAAEVDGWYLHPVGGADVAAAAADLQRVAYADLPPTEPARQLGWVWALALLVLTLPELRTGWRTLWSTRRAGRS